MEDKNKEVTSLKFTQQPSPSRVPLRAFARALMKDSVELGRRLKEHGDVETGQARGEEVCMWSSLAFVFLSGKAFVKVKRPGSSATVAARRMFVKVIFS